MRLRGVAGRLVSWGLVAIVLAPALALPVAALVVRGPSGEARVSVLPIGLTAFDGFARTCLVRSVLAAALVASGSLLIGIPIGRIASRRRGLGLGLLGSAIVAPPVVGAIGLREAIFPAFGDWSRSTILERWFGALGGPDLAGWLAFCWIGLAGGVPLVALATRRALDAIDPPWEDAARLSGASRGRIWRDLSWPMVRPRAFAAASFVFGRAMFDPSVPLVFGLRRSLAYQVVESATSTGGWLPRAASLALLGLGIAAAVRLLASLRSGAATRGASIASRTPPGVADSPRKTLVLCVLLVANVLGWLPTASVVALAIEPGSKPLGSAIGESVRSALEEPEIRRLAIASACVGLAVAGIGLAVVGPLRARRFPRLGSLPPLAIGVGALAIPWLLSAASEGFAIRGVSIRLGWPGELARWLDPYATPGILLVWSLVSCSTPGLASVARLASLRSRPILIDAAVVLGVRRSRARRSVAWPLVVPPPARAAILVAVLSATGLAPALLLAPSSRERTLGPGLLLLSDEPGGLRPAAALGVLMTGLNLLAWASAGREGREMLAGNGVAEE